MTDLLIKRTAFFSPCQRYRYMLEREINKGETLGVIMVNPSTATEFIDDPTIRKVMGFASRNGYGNILIGNKFAWRSTDIKGLREIDDPIGPDNDGWLQTIMFRSETVLVAWGTLAKLPKRHRERWRDIVRLADISPVELICLGTTEDGQPKHPLYVNYEQPFVPWSPPI